MENVATHPLPAWQASADFLIRADLETHGIGGRSEQIWARRLDADHFEICCIPFFTYGMALGDIVRCSADYVIQHISRRQGHKVLRVAVADRAAELTLHEPIHRWIESAGLLYEWYSPGYLAVDVPPDGENRIDLTPLNQLCGEGTIAVEIDE